MRTFSVPGYLDAIAGSRKWYLYTIILEPDPGRFFIKIGISTDPLRRASDFRQGLPLKPTILWCKAGSRSSAYTLEHRLHKVFEQRNTFGEWFLFDAGDKDLFKSAIRVELLAVAGVEAEWNVTTTEQWLEYVSFMTRSANTIKMAGIA